MRGLEEKVVIVTGGAQGIGQATSLRLHEEGCTVIVADRNAEGAEKVAADIRFAGGKAQSIALDVADRQSWADAVSHVVRTHSRIDGLVNNAGDRGVEQDDQQRADTAPAVERFEPCRLAAILNGGLALFVVHGNPPGCPRRSAAPSALAVVGPGQNAPETLSFWSCLGAGRAAMRRMSGRDAVAVGAGAP